MKNLRKALLTVVGTATLLIGTTTFANVTGTVTLPDGTKPEKTIVNISKITNGSFDSSGYVYADDAVINYNPSEISGLKSQIGTGEPAYKNTWGVRVKAEKDGIEYFAPIKAEDGKPFTVKLKKAYPIEFNITDIHGNKIPNIYIGREDYDKYILANAIKIEDHETIYLANYEPGKHTFEVCADGYKSKKVTVNVKSYRTKVDVVLEAKNGKSVTGSLKLEDGTPVTKNMFVPRQVVEENLSPLILNLDKNGQFKFVAQVGETYRSAETDSLIKLKNGLVYKASINGGNELIASYSSNLDIVLHPVYTQKYIVLDENGNNITSKATVSVYKSETYNFEFRVNPKVSTTEIVDSNRLECGTYKTVVKVDGYDDLVTEITITPDVSTGTFTFTMAK